MGRTRARIILGCLALVFGVAAWMGLAPAALGGGVTYATVTGTSMEPKLHRGDLVVLRAGAPYRVGDVVGYRDPRLHRLVLHRIVGGDSVSGFEMRGDNNDFTDPTHPRPAEIAGRLWTRVPQAGAVVGRFRSPGAAALLVGGLVLLPGAPRRRRRPADAPAAPAPGAPPAPAPAPARDLDARRLAVAVLAGAAILLAAVAGYSYSRPSTHSVTVDDAYRQSGAFSYTASARRGAAYPDGVVRTGQAVFPRLSPAMDVSFAYRLSSDDAMAVSGTGALEATISDGQGWSRTIPVAASRPFSGPRAVIAGTLRLDRLRATVRAFERETGARATGYAVTITPRVDVSGRVGGTPVGDRYAPSLAMRLDATRLALGTSPTGEPAALTSERPGSLVRDVPAEISAGGFSLPVFRARAIGLLGFEAALGIAILLGLPILLEMRRSEAAAIRVRMGGRLMEVAAIPHAAPGGCVDLERMSDLARIAERAEMPIMACERDGRGRYAVLVGDVLYRYATRAPAGADAPASPPARVAMRPVMG